MRRAMDTVDWAIPSSRARLAMVGREEADMFTFYPQDSRRAIFFQAGHARYNKLQLFAFASSDFSDKMS